MLYNIDKLDKTWLLLRKKLMSKQNAAELIQKRNSDLKSSAPLWKSL